MNRNRIFYVIALLISIWLMIMYEGVTQVTCVVALFIIPFLLKLYTLIAKRFVRVQCLCNDNNVIVDEETSIIINVVNDSYLPIPRVEIPVEIRDLKGITCKRVVVTNLEPFCMRSIILNVTPKYCGSFVVFARKFKLFDFLNLTSTSKKQRNAYGLLVHPKIKGLDIEISKRKYANLDDIDEYSDIYAGNEKSQIFGVREYRENDSLRDVHWKLSAKSEDLVVKEYSKPLDNAIDIYVDTVFDNDRSMLKLDKYLTYILSLKTSLENENMKVKLFALLDDVSGFIEVEFNYLLMIDYMIKVDKEIMYHEFEKNNVGRRGFLVSTRDIEDINNVSAEFMKVILGDDDKFEKIYFEDSNFTSSKVISIDVEHKEESTSIVLKDEIELKTENTDTMICSYVMRLLLVFFGAVYPIAIFYDTIFYDISLFGIVTTVFIAEAIMLIINVTKINKKIKTLIVLVTTIGFTLYLGVNSIVQGANSLFVALGNQLGSKINYASYQAYSYGLIKEDANIDALILLIAFIVTIILFCFTWRSIASSIHVLIATFFTAICYLYSATPDGFYLLMVVGYLLVLTVMSCSYSNIAKKQKKKVAKSLYNSTLNIGALCGIIIAVMFSVIVIGHNIKVTFTGGYQRSESIIEMKKSINTFIDKMDIKGFIDSIFDGDTATGGVNGGKLGRVGELKFTDEKILIVSANGNIDFPLYLKSFTGMRYNKNQWEEITDYESTLIENALHKSPGLEEISMYGLANMTFWLHSSGSIGHTGFGNLYITSLKKSDNIYVPYGAKLSPDIEVLKDGVYKSSYVREREYNVYTMNNLSLIGKKELSGTWDYAQEAYFNAIGYGINSNGAYLGMPYTSDSGLFIEDFQQAISVEQFYDGKWYNLEDGIEEIGYTPYIRFVQNFLSSRCEYSLSPGKTDENKDFIMDFLYSKKKGYCTHFASAGVLLFRSMGIPARYCEGYFVNPTDEQQKEYDNKKSISIEVTDRYAHAWVEIYIKGYGWMPVEVTPGYTNKIIDEPVEITTPDESTTKETEDKTTSLNPLETRTTGAKETKNTTDTSSKERSVPINMERWLGAILLLSVVTIVFGRKSYKDKKAEDARESNINDKSALACEQQLKDLLRYVDAEYFENIDNVSKAKWMTVKCQAEYNDNIRLLEIFDKANYSNKEITDEEKEFAKTHSSELKSSIFKKQKVYQKFMILYIKCLYLK